MNNSLVQSLRLPAEWEPQSFLQLTFPHPDSDWAYLLEEASVCFVDIIEAAARFQKVLVVCDDVKRVRAYFSNTSNIYFAEAPSNDTWARDHSGITVVGNGKAIVQDYIFNGWGKKFEAARDNQITKSLFDQGILQHCELKSFDFVLEGGSIESDGLGTIITTTECLLEENRNPQYTQKEIEAILKQNFGAKRVLWLNSGYLAGDDTDSHIDTIARLCNENTIAYVGCNNPEDEHFEALQKMKTELEQFTTENGMRYNLVELPFPDPCFDDEGNRLPATYANFTIINGAVLLPVYGLKQDAEAVDILQQIFPEKEIIPINCRVLVEQHGSLHCVTMQYPEAVGLNIEN
ncbi:agmatine deiminase family protein [uncultured Draconibacterium sp.]|uniref:agmatine deiminase family protein n=1 Tax=uncultured Draconibacterium sp. TaxID=1573823 RepID=UPI0029C757FF|nr:agmatine deiminase family protein [uncultured Draconibacterium sp.]